MKTAILIRSFFFLFLIWTSPTIHAQQTISVYENIGNGTAKWAGISYGRSQGVGNINFQIPATATLKKILVVALCTRRSTEKGEFEINGIKFLLNSANLITRYQPISINNYDTPAEIFLYDATLFFSIGDLNNLTIQTFVNNNTATIETITRQINVLVEYSDGVNNISYVIDLFVPNPLVQNNHDNYPLKLINKPNYSMPVLLSLNGHFSPTGLNDTINSGTRIFVSNNYLGILGGNDPHCTMFEKGATNGSFEYSQNEIRGLYGDSIDRRMFEDDALSEIGNLMDFNDSLVLKLSTNKWNAGNGHAPASFTFAYTTTCEEFTVSTPEPQKVCKNEPLQLNVTGGNKYEWLPKRGLNCYDCPNPVVSTDSSRFYTVRVWNNDTCSIVRPVHVSVHELPKFNTADITPTQCADSTGKIAVSKHASVSGTPLWSLDGGPFEMGSATLKTYENLPEGTYTITLKDDEGCTRDTSLNVGFTIPTKASFVVNPEEGASPLEISVNNTSQNYTNSEWFLQGSYIDTSLSQLFLDTSGLYTLQLITWYKDPKCADTSSRTILVYDTLVVSTPNVFTPNADGVNDFFGVTSNQPATVKCTLFNRWGNEVHQNEVTSSTAGYIPLWDGKNFDEGVYFYKISVQTDKMETKEMNGFVHLEK
jgi:gliding motility-associated-like protein